jgi:hypothetical protein
MFKRVIAMFASVMVVSAWLMISYTGATEADATTSAVAASADQAR